MMMFSLKCLLKSSFESYWLLNVLYRSLQLKINKSALKMKNTIVTVFDVSFFSSIVSCFSPNLKVIFLMTSRWDSMSLYAGTKIICCVKYSLNKYDECTRPTVVRSNSAGFCRYCLYAAFAAFALLLKVLENFGTFGNFPSTDITTNRTTPRRHPN